nr:hypothetical protein 39.4 kDa [uncultured bacterium]
MPGPSGVPSHPARAAFPLVQAPAPRLASVEGVPAGGPMRFLFCHRIELAGPWRAGSGHAAGPVLGDVGRDPAHGGRPAGRHAHDLIESDVGLLVTPHRINDVAHVQAVRSLGACALGFLPLGFACDVLGQVAVAALGAAEGIPLGRLRLAAFVGDECGTVLALEAIGDHCGGWKFAGFGVLRDLAGLHGVGSLSFRCGLGVPLAGHLGGLVFVRLHDGDDGFGGVPWADLHHQRDTARAIASAFAGHAVQVESAALDVPASARGKVSHPNHIPKAAGFVLGGCLASLVGFGPLHAIGPGCAGQRDRNTETGFACCLRHVHQNPIGQCLRAGVDVDHVVCCEQRFVTALDIGVFAFKHCFARCLSRLLTLILMVVIHVGIRLGG